MCYLCVLFIGLENLTVGTRSDVMYVCVIQHSLHYIVLFVSVLGILRYTEWVALYHSCTRAAIFDIRYVGARTRSVRAPKPQYGKGSQLPHVLISYG